MAIRKLSDPEIEEVSLVDHGANLRKFFFVKNANKTDSESTEIYEFNKADTDIKVESNGTVDGTTISINGKKINPINFYFSMYKNENETWENDVFCDYAIEEKGEKGDFSNVKLYRLQKVAQSKEAGDVEDVKKSASLIQEYLKEVNLDHLGEDGVVNLAKSLDILADYKTLVPPDVLEALNEITSIAVKKDEKQEEEKKPEEGENKMTEENKEEKTEETSEKTEETNTEATEGSKKEETESSNVIVMEKEELTSLVADITEKVTAKVTQDVTSQVSALLDEKLKKEEDEEMEVSLEEISEMVLAAANG